MRKVQLVDDEYYHIFNRGVDKREIFGDLSDRERLFQSMDEFNALDPIGSIYENSFRDRKERNKPGRKLVSFVAYCLNPNHYHFILKQLSEKGIEKFMHRLGIGYSKYYNKKYERFGPLFQGAFKSIHIHSNIYLSHLSVYINLNNKIHSLSLGNSVSKSQSSWREYTDYFNEGTFCADKRIVLADFKNGEEYQEFAHEVLPSIIKRKEIESLVIE